MDKYDGWTVQNLCGKNPWLVIPYFHRTKQEVIRDFELLYGKGSWRKERREGNFKLVKVKFLEAIKASTNLKNKSLGKLAEDLGVSFSAAKIISDHAQPGVTEEWIENWVNHFIADVAEEDVQGSDYEYFADKVRMDFKDALKEAGVGVSG